MSTPEADANLAAVLRAVAKPPDPFMQAAHPEHPEHWLDYRVMAADRIDALRAELAALKARRCDGCAHGDELSDTPEPWCNVHSHCVSPDFSCAAWTEKP